MEVNPNITIQKTAGGRYTVTDHGVGQFGGEKPVRNGSRAKAAEYLSDCAAAGDMIVVKEHGAVTKTLTGAQFTAQEI
ncbi:hypothetical protein [Halorubrum sp. Atlit-26R]|jgi:hypothetical protein|uniref:hypothetical protein n=1 Tax=Halorubrum sp. Atlit-26R TaxID=2282128 RepID=UPI0011C40365|nr:hypothetical protein [Halorubrum sp. Atlit-26R]